MSVSNDSSLKSFLTNCSGFLVARDNKEKLRKKFCKKLGEKLWKKLCKDLRKNWGENCAKIVTKMF